MYFLSILTNNYFEIHLCFCISINHIFLLLITILFCGYITVCSLVDFLLGVSMFPFGAVTNKVVMNICVQVFIWTQVLLILGKYLGVKWLSHILGVSLVFFL